MDVMPAGEEIGGYRIVRVAGRGAVGVVYLAEHMSLGRKVAIKTLGREYAGEPEFRARFDREAQGAARINHPNITAVFDAGEHKGTPYLVMTYIDGPDLERVLQDSNGPLDPQDAIYICTEVAEALDAAADHGLAHRDVKPANILLAGWNADPRQRRDRPPHVYLTDFGLTKHNAAATVTRTGQFVGTLLYMAPEQIEGSAVAASDQYSLACVLWECLTGLPPFVPAGGSNLSLLTAHMQEAVPRISERKGAVSPRLDAVFAKALSKKAADRYPSAMAFMRAAADALGMASPVPQAQQHGTQPDPSGFPSSEGKTSVIPAEYLRESMQAATGSRQPGTPDSTPGQQQGVGPGGPDYRPQPYGPPTGFPPGAALPTYRGGGEQGSRAWIVWLLVSLAVVSVGVVIAVLIAQSG